jgi:ADP-ribose pyrophosphatase YjhB (NUDIX family)
VDQVLRAERGYATPKVDVRAVVPEPGGSGVLFVREVTDGLWALPGGWADSGVPPSEMVAREVLEETGYVVRPVKLLAVLDKSRHAHPPDVWGTYKLFFLCRIEGGSPRPSFETPECGFFTEAALPSLSTPRNTEGQIRRMFEHLRRPELPTDFD